MLDYIYDFIPKHEFPSYSAEGWEIVDDSIAFCDAKGVVHRYYEIRKKICD